MKINLLKVNSHGKRTTTGNWWTCKILCDNCGKEIYKGVLWATQPDMSEKDYCEKCKKEIIG